MVAEKGKVITQGQNYYERSGTLPTGLANTTIKYTIS